MKLQLRTIMIHIIQDIVMDMNLKITFQLDYKPLQISRFELFIGINQIRFENNGLINDFSSSNKYL